MGKTQQWPCHLNVDVCKINFKNLTLQIPVFESVKLLSVEKCNSLLVCVHNTSMSSHVAISSALHTTGSLWLFCIRSLGGG